MKKISIIYWTNGGNVETLAKIIAKELNLHYVELNIKYVSDAKITDVIEADALAFGSPSMDNNRIEQQQMEPFIKSLKTLINNNKKTILFGSYGWDEGKFMEEWEIRMKEYGFNVVGSLAVKESPSEDELELAKELALKLVK